MTVSERCKKADELHCSGYNCAQAVLCAFDDKLNLDESILIKVAEGFGLGMGSTNGTCGAISGAVIVAGIMNSSGDASSPTKASTYALSKLIEEKFVQMNSSSICRGLKGINTGKVLRSCGGCIEDAVIIASDVLFGERV